MDLQLILLIVYVIISLIILLKGADLLVDGSSDLAKFFSISPLIIGLTIVAFGTSLPELLISLLSNFGNSPDISVGNIIGSNIVNIGLIIGLSAAFTPLFIKKSALKHDFPFMLGGTVLFVILGFLNIVIKKGNYLDFGDGLILLTGFGLFIWIIIKDATKKRTITQKKMNQNGVFKNNLLIIFGLGMLIFGAKLFVSSSSKLALKFGVSEAIIGLTLVAIGTSLPELFTSVVAAIKKQNDIAIGNIIGSNIFNIFFILGITSVLKPIELNIKLLVVDSSVMIFFSVMFYMFASNRKIEKHEGIILVFFYLAYITYLVYNF